MLRGFFAEIPVEIEEAALIDGCTRLGAFRRVLLPIAKPGFAATAILSFILSWNEFLYAIVLTGTEAKTAPVAVYAFIGASGPGAGVLWGQVCAAGVLCGLPVIIFAALVQRHIVRGLSFGAVK